MDTRWAFYKEGREGATDIMPSVMHRDWVNSMVRRLTDSLAATAWEQSRALAPWAERRAGKFPRW